MRECCQGPWWGGWSSGEDGTNPPSFCSLFVLQPPGVPDYPPADGYAFSNTVYKRGPLLDQGAAVAAFKQTVSRHVDR